MQPNQSVLKTMDPPIVNWRKHLASYKIKWDFGQGVPFFLLPFHIVHEVFNGLSNHSLSAYSPDEGLPHLRRLLMELEREKGVQASADHILITAGANHAFYTFVQAFLSKDTPAVLLSPFYFNHAMALDLFSIPYSEVSITKELDPNFEELERLLRTTQYKMLVVVSPNNPTGRVYSEETLKHLVELAEQHHLLIFSDETYDKFVWDNASFYSIATYAQKAGVPWVTVGSFSKRFGMPGWRVGWMNLSSSAFKDEFPHVLKIQDTSTICAPRSSQLLAIHVLQKYKRWSDERLQEMKQVHHIFVEELEPFFPDISYSNGAMYFLPQVGHDDYRLSRNLAKKDGIFVLPGSLFGNGGINRIRLSFGNIEPDMADEAALQLRHALSRSL